MSSSEDTAFTVFPGLPMELRLRIWKLSIPDPQIVKVQVHLHPEDIRSCFTTNTHPSGLFRACKMSRAEILRQYKVEIKSERGRKSVIRLDGVNDIVWIYQRPSNADHRSLYKDTIQLSDSFGGIEMLLLTGFEFQPSAIVSVTAQFRSLKKLFINIIAWRSEVVTSKLTLPGLYFIIAEDELYSPFIESLEPFLASKQFSLEVEEFLRGYFAVRMVKQGENHQIPEIINLKNIRESPLSRIEQRFLDSA